MKTIYLSSVVIFLLTSTIALADKPSWAGHGGKPTDYEKHEHKEKMTSKHKDKYKEEHDKDESEYDRDDDDEKHYYHKDTHRDSYGSAYEGQGQTNDEFIDKKVDETEKNWIGKFFDFLN